MEALFAPMRLLIAYPFLAFIPAAVFVVAALVPKSHAPRLVLVAGVVWGLYAIWETVIFFWSRAQPEGGGETIRVDLLLIAPVLLLATIVAIVAWWRAASNAG